MRSVAFAARKTRHPAALLLPAHIPAALRALVAAAFEAVAMAAREVEGSAVLVHDQIGEGGFRWTATVVPCEATGLAREFCPARGTSGLSVTVGRTPAFQDPVDVFQ